MLNRKTILILAFVVTPFLMGGGCVFSYFATIYNNSDQDIQLSFFSDYAHGRVDQITLEPNESFPMTLAVDFVQTITVKTEESEPVELQFSHPGAPGPHSPGFLDIYICTVDGSLRLTEIANRRPVPAGIIEVVSGDHVILPDVGFLWEEDSDNVMAVELTTSQDNVVSFEAPQVEEAISLIFNSYGCADSAAYQATVDVLPVPVFILADSELTALFYGQLRTLVGKGRVSVGQQFALEADMRDREPDLYTITWSVQPERMAFFDDASSVNPTLTLLDVGWLMVILNVSDTQTGLYAEDTITFLGVTYDDAGLMVDAGQDQTVPAAALVTLRATPFGADIDQSCKSSGESDTTQYLWQQDENNPAVWSDVSTFICGVGGYTDVPTPAPDSIEARFVRFRLTEAGTYRYTVTATDQTGAFQDTDYVVITVTSE